ncbi:MAG: outer membrane beta-barrel protein [Muribaculaceae bacterium]
MRTIFSFFIFAAFSVIAMAASAWDGDNKHWQMEFGAGPTFGYSKVLGLSNNGAGATIFGEARYAFSKVPVTVGLQLATNLYARDYFSVGDVIIGASGIDFFSTNIMLTGDYYFEVNDKINLFAGAGLGYCKINNSKDVEISDADFGAISVGDDGASGTVSFMPRVGVLLFNKIRLTVGYRFEEAANRSAFATAGFVLRF